jgi:hypothetical protein
MGCPLGSTFWRCYKERHDAVASFHSREGSLDRLGDSSASVRVFKAGDRSRRVNRNEQAETFVPSEAIGPSDICVAGQLSTTPSPGVPDGHGRALSSALRGDISEPPSPPRQVQGHSLDKIEITAYQSLELRVVGEGREGIPPMSHRIAVEIPVACEVTPQREMMARAITSLGIR